MHQIYIILAWEPSAVQVTKSLVTPAVYPHLNDLTGKRNFRPTQFSTSKLRAKNIPVCSPSSTNKIWGRSVEGFPSYEWSDKQTDKQRSQLYIYIFISVITVCLSVCLCHHNSGTPGPICLKFLFGNPGDPREFH